MKKNVKIFDYASAISERTHPQPEESTVFYRKYKEEISLSNPTTTYRKRRERLLEPKEESQKTYCKKIQK